MRALGRDLALAFSLLTVIPLRVEPPAPGARGHAADHFAVVGVAFGLVGAAVVYLAASARPASSMDVVAATIVVGWALLSRGLHWDGLSDVADAWTVAAERRHAVLKDSRAGAFGVLAIVSAFALQLVCLAAVLEGATVTDAMLVCVAVPVSGRLAASFGAWLGRPFAEAGLGASVTGRPGPGALSTMAVVIGMAALSWFAGGVVPVAALLGGLACAPVVPHLIASRFGGVNGDVLGASVVMTEVLTCGVAAIAVAVSG